MNISDRLTLNLIDFCTLTPISGLYSCMCTYAFMLRIYMEMYSYMYNIQFNRLLHIGYYLQGYKHVCVHIFIYVMYVYV